MESWKEEVCHSNGGKRCCKYLVTDGTDYECNKKVPQPETLKPLPLAEADNCEGLVKGLKNMEDQVQKYLDTDIRLGLFPRNNAPLPSS
jgi:hypothetical protein